MNKTILPVAIIVGLIVLFCIIGRKDFSRLEDVQSVQAESPVENKSHAQVSTPNEFKKEVKSDDKESVSDAMSEVDVNLSSKTTPAQHSTAQHSTAQHSTAQHSTAQHSTAQHLPQWQLLRPKKRRS